MVASNSLRISEAAPPPLVAVDHSTFDRHASRMLGYASLAIGWIASCYAVVLMIG